MVLDQAEQKNRYIYLVWLEKVTLQPRIVVLRDHKKAWNTWRRKRSGDYQNIGRQFMNKDHCFNAFVKASFSGR